MSETPDEVKTCRACDAWWRGAVAECPECGSREVEAGDAPNPVAPHDREVHRQVARLENFAQSLYALPERLANRLSESLHPYDVADAITDLLAPLPTPEPLAEWERELLYGNDEAAR